MSQITSQGSLCEYVRVRADHVIRRPPNISIIQGAGICLAGLSAWFLLFNDAKIKAGDRILINNGSGGVGTFAIQLAKVHGCHVTATSSPDNHDFLRVIGADIVLDYHNLAQNLSANPPAALFDAIVDCYGLQSELYANCEHYLKPEGIFASVAPAAESLLDTAKAGAGIFSQAWRPSWLGGNSQKFRYEAHCDSITMTNSAPVC
jgi:NADPH:quinone reductase-like Zn-dependent oxidoreductase